MEWQARQDQLHLEDHLLPPSLELWVVQEVSKHQLHQTLVYFHLAELHNLGVLDLQEDYLEVRLVVELVEEMLMGIFN